MNTPEAELDRSDSEEARAGFREPRSLRLRQPLGAHGGKYPASVRTQKDTAAPSGDEACTPGPRETH
jgi:hypothetical protein